MAISCRAHIPFAAAAAAQVSNHKSKADRLVQQADDVEDALSKEHADVDAAVVLFQKGAILDASRDDVGVVTIGQTQADLGIILTVNTVGACRARWSVCELTSM